MTQQPHIAVTFPSGPITSIHSASTNESLQNSLILHQPLNISSNSDSNCVQKEDEHSRNSGEYHRCSQNRAINSDNLNCDNDNSGMDLRNGIHDYHPSRFQQTELTLHSRNGEVSNLMNIRSENSNLSQSSSNTIANSTLKNISSQIFKIHNTKNLHNIHNIQRETTDESNDVILATNNINDLSTTQRNNEEFILRKNTSDDYNHTNSAIGIHDKLLESNLRSGLQNIERQLNFSAASISDVNQRKINLSPISVDPQKNRSLNNEINNDFNTTTDLKVSKEMRILKPSPLPAQHISLSSVQTIDSVSYSQRTLYFIPQNSHDKKYVIIKGEPLESFQVSLYSTFLICKNKY